MKDFLYRNSTQIVFGVNKVDEVGVIIKPFGNKVLLVYGCQSIKQSGLYQRIQDNLNRSGLQVIDHGGVQSNPVVCHAREGVSLAKKHKVDCVLAVGGGSVIDESKVIAFGALTENDIWGFFLGKSGKPEKALPIITVPTLAGTGSEMNPGAVLSDPDNKQKLGLGSLCLSPAVSILDPTLTLTVSVKNTMFGLVDAFSHVLESYLNGEDDAVCPIQDSFAEGLFCNLLEISKVLFREPQNLLYRSHAMWAACLANNVLLKTGRGKILYEIHGVAHLLGGLFNIQHGAAIAVAMPAWLNFRKDKKQKRIEQFTARVFGRSEMGVAEMQNWLFSIKAPCSLPELEIEINKRSLIIEGLLFVPEIKGLSRQQTEQIVDLMFNAHEAAMKPVSEVFKNER